MKIKGDFSSWVSSLHALSWRTPLLCYGAALYRVSCDEGSRPSNTTWIGLEVDPPTPVEPLDEISVPANNLSETLSPSHQLSHLQVLYLQKL